MRKPAKSSEAMKSALYEQLARVALALASQGRLQILEFVAQGERSVDALAAMTGLSVANTSKHLQALRQAGLVVARKEGLRVYYSLAGDDVVALVSALRAVAERRVAEVERLVEGVVEIDALDLVQQRALTRTTRRLLDTIVEPEWMRTDAVLAHARRFTWRRTGEALLRGYRDVV